MNTIEKLKDNEAHRIFADMSDEEQGCLAHIGNENLEYLLSSGSYGVNSFGLTWAPKGKSSLMYPDSIYRIKPDYQPEPGEFTKPYHEWCESVEPDSKPNAKYDERSYFVKCLYEIDRLQAVLSFTKQELGAADLEIKRLRRLFVCQGCKTDRYKQIHCHLCGAKFEP